MLHIVQVDIDGNGTLDMNEFLYLLDVHFDFCGCQPTEDLLPVFRYSSALLDLVVFVSNPFPDCWTDEAEVS